MPISNGFRATSFSIALSAVLMLEGCGSSSETGSYSGLCYYYYATARESLPEFDTDFFQTPDSTGQRLDVYFSLRVSRLKFERIGNSYRASYTVNVRIDREGEPGRVKDVQRVVWKPSYPSSSDSAYDAFLLSFDASPGEYSITVSVTDDLSGLKAERHYEKRIPLIAGKDVAMSDILLLARFDTVGQGRKITPFILRNAGLLSDTLKFFAVLLARTPLRDTVYFDVYGLRNRERVPSGFGPMFSSRSASYDPCAQGIDTVRVFGYSIPVALDSGFSYVFGAVPKPPSGNYLLTASLVSREKKIAYSVLPFRVRGRYFPDVTGDLPGLVSSLRYIASPAELQKITDVKTDSSLKANLLNFWARYGGYTKMAEYYQRVSQANRLFSTCVDGWRTPMGMFYIVCGPPDYVECRGAYSERWMYIRESTNDRVVADFRLVSKTTNPDDRYYGLENLYSNLDFWSYYVSRWRTPF